MKRNPVQIGMDYENKVVEILQSCGLDAWRTNTANPDDPEQYKAGFDGGVDIMARTKISKVMKKCYVFYIQCKCHKEDLTKSAIAEVYAGMHARNGFSKQSIPVVFVTSEATEETRQFARSLGVELILCREMELIKHARITGKMFYANYGTLMRVLLYHYTKDIDLLETLPVATDELSSINLKEDTLIETKLSLDDIQAKWDVIASKELKLQQERQRTLDKTKLAMMQNIQSVDFYRNDNNRQRKSDTPTITKDSG